MTTPDGAVIDKATSVISPSTMRLFVGYIDDTAQHVTIEKQLVSIVPEASKAWSVVDTDGGAWTVTPVGCGCSGSA